MKRASATIVALVATLATAGCSLHPNDNTLPGQVATGDDGYPVTVVFDSVENLVPNSTVQLDNVAVGTVTAIEFVDWKAEVDLRLEKGVILPANATFTIGQKTLLGAQYVQVDVPEDPQGQLEAGARVEPSQTGEYPATEEVLGAVSLLLNNGGLSQISTITEELSTGLDGRTLDARGLVGQLNVLLGTLDEHRDEITGSLDEIDLLAAELAAERATVGDAIDALGPAFATLESQRTSLVQSVTALGDLGATTSALLDTSSNDIVTTIDALVPTLQQVSTSSALVPDALKFAGTLPFPVMTTQKAVFGDYANLFATIDVSLEALTTNFLGGGLLSSDAAALSQPLVDLLGSLVGPGANTVEDAGSSVPTAPSSPPPSAGPPSSTVGPVPTPAPAASSCGLLALLGAC